MLSFLSPTTPPTLFNRPGSPWAYLGELVKMLWWVPISWDELPAIPFSIGCEKLVHGCGFVIHFSTALGFFCLSSREDLLGDWVFSFFFLISSKRFIIASVRVSFRMMSLFARSCMTSQNSIGASGIVRLGRAGLSAVTVVCKNALTSSVTSTGVNLR